MRERERERENLLAKLGVKSDKKTSGVSSWERRFLAFYDETKVNLVRIGDDWTC